MGIYDREYYRDDGHSFLGSIAGRGRVCFALIGINVVCYIVQMATRATVASQVGVDIDIPRGFPHHVPNSGWFTDSFDFKPDAILNGQLWRLLTYAFLHSTNDVWHIVWNMLILWWAGGEVEGIYGSREFLAFYLVGALAGGIGQMLAVFAKLDVGTSMIGASGAVTAVLVLFALHYPTRVIYIMLVIPCPVLLLVALNVLRDVLGLVGGAGGVAFACHLGGAAFAWVYFRKQIRITNWLPDLRGYLAYRRQPRLRVYRGEPDSEHHTARTPQVADEHLEAELDSVLAKVARHGKSSLTEREQTILLRASEIYRNRRK